MRTKGIKVWAGLLVLIIALSLGACGGGSGSKDASASAGGGSAPTFNLAKDESFEREMPMPAPQAAAAPVMESMDADMNTGGYTTEAGSVQAGRKITFRADLSINTKNFDADYKAINDMITAAGGYVANENMTDYSSYGRNSGRYSYMSARIPAEGYDSFLDRLSEIGEVTNKNKSSDDLTSQYFDTEARIEMLEIRKERLMNYLVEAEDAADIVEFERELSNVLYDLDSYQGNKRQLDRLVEFATIDVNLNEVITPETIGKDGEPLGDRASNAFALSVNGVERFLKGAVVFFAGAAPVIALLVVIAVIVWLIVLLIRKLMAMAGRSKWGESRQRRRDEAGRRRAAKIAARHRPPVYQQPPAYPPQQGYQPPAPQAPTEPLAPQAPPEKEE